MDAGRSAMEKAKAASASAERLRAKAARMERNGQHWEQGGRAEAQVGVVLAPLEARGFHVLHDLHMPGSRANIDHVVIGPTGVFVIDTKAWTGSIAVTPAGLRQNGRRRDDAVEKLLWYRDRVTACVEEALGRAVNVWPLICFAGDARVTPAISNVARVINVDILFPFIENAPTPLEPDEVRRVVDVVSQALGGRQPTLPFEPSPPVEPVVFLTPWQKGGRHRLYVKDSAGDDLGFVDLSAGETRPVRAAAGALLDRLVPHLASWHVPEVLAQAADQSLRRRVASRLRGRSGGIAAEPIVVAFHWRGHGRERLYVSRIANGEKSELGWTDLHQESRAAADEVVAWCDRQHRLLQQQR